MWLEMNILMHSCPVILINIKGLNATKSDLNEAHALLSRNGHWWVCALDAIWDSELAASSPEFPAYNGLHWVDQHGALLFCCEF